MAKYQYMILSSAVAGREDECDTWYDETHLKDVCKIAGVVGARRQRIRTIRGRFSAPEWRSVAVYDIESDDPESVLNAISAAAGSAEMTLSDALKSDDLVQILVGEPAAEI